MKIFAIPFIVSLANAISIGRFKRSTSLSVKLDPIGNTAVKASITNEGTTPLRLFKTGSILDDLAVEKVTVYQDRAQVPFSGVRVYISTASLENSAFRTIAPGETIEKEFDVAHAHDVTAGGTYQVEANSAISYAASDSNDLIETLPIQSNRLSMRIDGAEALKTRSAFLSKQKRTALQPDCTGTQKDSLLRAFPICQSRAIAASAAARNNSAKIIEYFKQDTTAIRNTVSGVFDKIAAECANTTSGYSKQYCTDKTRDCGGGVIAYTYPAQSYIVYCPSYFSRMSERSTICHGDDKPFVVMHEMTHLREVKGTDDYGVYGYEAVKKLRADQNLNHADTYALFANAIEIGGSC